MNIIRGLVYILQREDYNPSRFLSFVYSDWRWGSFEKRQKIDWTHKSSAIYYFVWGLLVLLVVISIYLWHFWSVIFILSLIILLPILSLLVLFFFSPIDLILKKIIISKASNILLTLKTPVIGITGSYGKTSLKEILAIVLASGLKITRTPNNINTDLGIANFIISNKEEIEKSNYFIVEMGAYKIGDIAKICDLVKPQYSFLTGINESHLERFGGIENTIKAKFELGERTSKKLFLNFTDQNIKDNYLKFKLPENIGVDYSSVSNINILPKFSGLSFVYKGKTFSTRLLAKHNIILIVMALSLAGELGLDFNNVIPVLACAPVMKNRLEPIWNNASQLMVIDDSYNGNFNGFVSGLEVLSRAIGRRLVITPGLVELGSKNEERHREIARLYAANKIDLVLLIKNSATLFIIDEFKKINFTNYKVYPDVISAHNDLGSILKKGDTIIFQNDWPDNYK